MSTLWSINFGERIFRDWFLKYSFLIKIIITHEIGSLDEVWIRWENKPSCVVYCEEKAIHKKLTKNDVENKDREEEGGDGWVS